MKWRIYKVPSRWGLPWEAYHELHIPVMRFHTFEEAIGYADTHQVPHRTHRIRSTT